MKTKICTKCGIEKSVSEFQKNKTHKDGLQSSCKLCCKQIAKKYYQENKGEIQKRVKKHYEENKEEMKSPRKKYYEEHKEEIEEYQQEYRDSHKLENKKYKDKYYQDNKQSITEKNIEYRETHIDEWRKYFNEYCSRRRKEDVSYRILCNLRQRLRGALKGNSKSDSTKKLLGCSIEFLKNHLQTQFVKGMTWDNHGNGYNGKKEWHIDHIKPCVLFDLSKPTEQRKCFNYTNLQPLWAKENRKKSNKYKEK